MSLFLQRRTVSCCIAGLVAGTAVLRAQDPSMAAYKQMGIDDLMNLDVTSVTKAPEPYVTAPAAIDVITGEAIARSGATSLPQALRLADNLQVAQETASNWAISARGFDANLSNKLLVLIDGRAVYTPLYGGVLWQAQDTLLADLDRIEVISGPGATLWGANAVNGVINVVTKSAKDTQGALVEQSVGDELRDQTAVRYGGTVEPGVYFRASAEYTNHGPEVFPSGAGAPDSWDSSRASFRLDSDRTPGQLLTVQGDLYRTLDFLGAVGDAGFRGGDLLGRWTKTEADGASQSVQVYYDRADASQPEAGSPATPPYLTGFPASALTDYLTTYDLTIQDNRRLGPTQLVWGGEGRFTHEVDGGKTAFQFSPAAVNQSLYGGFVQDEWAVTDQAKLTAGTKLEHDDYTGWEVQPSVRAQWSPAAGQSFWGAVSRAVRTPSRYDRDLSIETGLASQPPTFKLPAAFLQDTAAFTSETVVAYDLGYRGRIGSQLTGSVSAFLNAYDHLRSVTGTPASATYPYPFPDEFQNNLEGETHGAELTADWQAASFWRLHAGFTLLNEHLHVRAGTTDATGGRSETADPQHQWSVRSSWDLPARIQLDAAWRWVGALTMDNGPVGGPVVATVPHYDELDVRVAWRPVPALELSVTGQNLLHSYHLEYGFPGPSTEAIRRGVYGRAAWRY